VPEPAGAGLPFTLSAPETLVQFIGSEKSMVMTTGPGARTLSDGGCMPTVVGWEMSGSGLLMVVKEEERGTRWFRPGRHRKHFTV